MNRNSANPKEGKMEQQRIKVALLLYTMLAVGTFFLAVGNEIDIQDLRNEITVSDSLHYEAQDQLADIAVIIAKYEAYLALYGPGETTIRVEASDSLLVAPTPVDSDFSLWWLLPIVWLVGVVLISLFFRGASKINRTYDLMMDEQLEEYRGQD
jgi:hypothetical protein